MSIGALIEEVLADSHSQVSRTDVSRKVVTALRHHRDKRFWWSERTFTFSLVAGKNEYARGDGPPLDLVEVVGNRLWLLYGGSEDDRRPIRRATRADFDRLRLWGTSREQPTVFGLWGEKLRLYPIPNSSTDVVEGPYVVDIGVPEIKYEGGSFVFYAPGGLRRLTTTEFEAIDNDWTNNQGAYQMLKARVEYLVYRDVLHNPQKAEDALGSWLEQTAVLEEETEKRTAGSTGYIRGTLLGDDDWLEYAG